MSENYDFANMIMALVRGPLQEGKTKPVRHLVNCGR